MFPSLIQVVFLVAVASLASAAPASSPISPSSCTYHLSLSGKDLIFAYDQGASSTLLTSGGSVEADRLACFEWAKSQGYYVAVVSTDQVQPGKFKCFGKNVPHYPDYKGNMFHKVAWQSIQYLGPYDVSGYDVPIRWSGTYGQGLSLCDSFTLEGQADYKCKQYPQVRTSTILLAAGCHKPE